MKPSFKSTLLVALFALALAGLSSLAQGPYYPVSPAGSQNYTGTPVTTSPAYSFLQTKLQALYPTKTLQVPPPATFSAPNTMELAEAVKSATQTILAGGAPMGVNLDNLARQAVAYRTTERSSIAGAISDAIILDGVATNAQKIANFNTVTNALAISQPTLIDTILPTILAKAGAVGALAQGIPQFVATAVAAIPRDLTRIASIVGNGAANVASANLTPAQRTTLFIDPSTGYIKTLLGSATAGNKAALIDVIVKGVTNSSFLSLATLDQILDASVAALPTKSNRTLAAVAAGALRSQGASAAQIRTKLGTANAPTIAYTNAFVDGYTSANQAAFQTLVMGNSNADAAAAGALVKGSISTAQIVQTALTSGSAAPKEVIRAMVAAGQDAYSAIVNGAFTGTTPYGTATHADIAEGAVNAAKIENAGSITQTVIQKTAAAATPAWYTLMRGIVDAAIVGAHAAGNEGTFADIVNKAEVQARSTSGASAELVRQAIDSINNAYDPTNSPPNPVGIVNPMDRPHYIAVVAALAGADNPTKRQEIRDASYGPVTIANPMGGELLKPAIMGDVTAATNGANLVESLRTGSGYNAVKYNNTINALTSAVSGPSPSNSVLADLYGAILVNATEASSILAAAIRQSGLSQATLTTAAMNAGRVTSFTYDPALTLVGQVAAYAKANPGEALNYVGLQIVNNPGMTKDIATAWVAVDPDHAHWVSHAAAFNDAKNVSGAVRAIFNYAQILNPTPQATAAPHGAIIDQPAAAAAITAGLTSGILEANLNTVQNPDAEKNALVATITAAVVAASTDNGNFLGPLHPFADSATATFRQSDGTMTGPTFNLKTPSTYRTVGAAGAITGYVAEVTKPNDLTITATTAAVLTAASAGGARPFALEIAQAAAQALRWISTRSMADWLTSTAADDIANAIAPSVVGFATLAQLKVAAQFGISEADPTNGRIGAGALGLNYNAAVNSSGNANSNFYIHRSATGDPVTDIFNL